MSADAGMLGGRRGDVAPFDRTVPPVIPVAMVAMAAAVTGGVILSAGAAGRPSLTVPTVFVVAGVALELVAAAMALRVRPFAWGRFGQVFGWTLLAYLLQSFLILYSFIRNDIPAKPMATLAIGLFVFATDVPLMIAFTVARYQRTDE